MLLTSPEHDRWAALTALAAGTMTWQSTTLIAGLLVAWTAIDLLAEWRARRALGALTRAAPAGMIMIRRDVSRGRTLWLAWEPASDRLRRQSRT